jgi:hypothetical protein
MEKNFGKSNELFHFAKKKGQIWILEKAEDDSYVSVFT